MNFLLSLLFGPLGRRSRPLALGLLWTPIRSAGRFWASTGLALLMIDLGMENQVSATPPEQRLVTALETARTTTLNEGGSIVALTVLACAFLTWRGRGWETLFSIIAFLSAVLIAAGEGGSDTIIVLCGMSLGFYLGFFLLEFALKNIFFHRPRILLLLLLIAAPVITGISLGLITTSLTQP